MSKTMEVAILVMDHNGKQIDSAMIETSDSAVLPNVGEKIVVGPHVCTVTSRDFTVGNPKNDSGYLSYGIGLVATLV